MKGLILVTGANGFVGRNLVCTLLKKNYSLRILAHSQRSAQQLKDDVSTLLDVFCMDDIVTLNDWQLLMTDVDTVVHCGAQLHPANANSKDAQQEFMQANYEVTLNLATNAANNKVRRFVFLSSMGVFGNMKKFTPFTEDTPLEPLDFYGVSKLKAEQGLQELSDKIELVIIRPPLVYGPKANNNFKKLFSLVNKGLPLPLGAIKNKRHFIGINNLVDFIITCIASEKAKNEVFLVSDNEALSIPELIGYIGRAMNKKNRLIPIPSMVLKLMFKLTGLSRLSEQLFYNIEIDSQKARTLLEWYPPYSVQEELQLAVSDFLAKN